MKRKNLEKVCWLMAIIGGILVVVFRYSNHSIMWFGLGIAIASLLISAILEPIKIDDNEFILDDDYSVFEEENDEDD